MQSLRNLKGTLNNEFLLWMTTSLIQLLHLVFLSET